MAEESAPSTGGTKHRSPNYPAFDLETALGKAKQLYDQYKRNSTHFDAACRSLGYNPTSSSGLRSIATLLGYGLLTETGKGDTRQVKLSPEAYQYLVVLDETDVAERLELLRTMATRPRVYNELASRFPSGLPDDARILKILKAPPLEFNPTVVVDVVKGFKTTYEFAQLGTRGILSEDESDKNGSDDNKNQDESEPNTGIKKPPPLKPPGGGSGSKNMQSQQLATSTFAIPMKGGREILLQMPEKPLKDDLPYLDLLTSYIDLFKKRANLDTETSEDQIESKIDSNE